MEYQKITNPLSTTPDDIDLPKFVTKKWAEFYEIRRKSHC